MKAILFTILGLLVFVSLVFTSLSLASRRVPPLGIQEGGLRRCPETPNCACSEYQDQAHVEPISISAPPAVMWQAAKEAVISLGGRIQTADNSYLWATFESKIFRFVDDLELRLDETHRVIHVRSASRIGHSDFGINKKRVLALRREIDRRQLRVRHAKESAF